jgi:beta-xylosidase
MSGIKQNYRVVKYVIDKTHANAYTKFVELGEPQDPSEEVKQAIREAGALKPEEMGIITPEDNLVSVTMENNAVVLLELFPV